MPRLHPVARVGLGLIAISTVWYAMVSLIAAVGSAHPYDLGEHLLVLAYCVASYGACRASVRITARPWRALAASYAIAAGLIGLVFVAMRLALGSPPTAEGVALNVGFGLVTAHASVAGAWFLARHVAQRIAAARAQHSAELRALRHQVDPHFLFNNLNILTGLVRRDPAQAERFSEQLAAFYRQLIRHSRDEWVELDDELALVASYLHLLEARFGGALRVQVHVPPRAGYFVVPGVLQELIGNALKHNHASASQPIDVAFQLDGDHLVARSSLRPRRHAEPSGRGLAGLQARRCGGAPTVTRSWSACR
ncbi:MAG TPA: histidine kinase [Kofleriaceae bacterium]|nr:histidine kinase [Kofleriaceae bacterium]